MANPRDNKTNSEGGGKDNYVLPLTLNQGNGTTVFWFRKESDRDEFARVFRATGAKCAIEQLGPPPSTEVIWDVAVGH